MSDVASVRTPRFAGAMRAIILSAEPWPTVQVCADAVEADGRRAQRHVAVQPRGGHRDAPGDKQTHHMVDEVCSAEYEFRGCLAATRIDVHRQIADAQP